MSSDTLPQMRSVLEMYINGCGDFDGGGCNWSCDCQPDRRLPLGRMFYLKPMYLCYMCHRDYLHDQLQPVAYGYCGDCEYAVDHERIEKTHNLSGTVMLELRENGCRNWRRCSSPDVGYRHPMSWRGPRILGSSITAKQNEKIPIDT